MHLHSTHPLPDGGRVRFRLPLASDRAGLHELLRSLGVRADDLEVRRALRWSPDRRVVVAVRWDGTAERLVGFASSSGTLVAAPDVAPLLQAYEDRLVA